MAQSTLIVGGPNKWDLMQALFSNNPINKVYVNFKIGNGETKTAWITSIGHKTDTCDENWIIRGTLIQDGDFTCEYSTQTRKGTLIILD